MLDFFTSVYELHLLEGCKLVLGFLGVVCYHLGLLMYASPCIYIVDRTGLGGGALLWPATIALQKNSRRDKFDMCAWSLA